eukprot:scaffold2752_cov106-Isochrysis_galbana.AAC.5
MRQPVLAVRASGIGTACGSRRVLTRGRRGAHLLRRCVMIWCTSSEQIPQYGLGVPVPGAAVSFSPPSPRQLTAAGMPRRSFSTSAITCWTYGMAASLLMPAGSGRNWGVAVVCARASRPGQSGGGTGWRLTNGRIWPAAVRSSRGRLAWEHQYCRRILLRRGAPFDGYGASVGQRDHLDVRTPMAPRRQLDVAKERGDVPIPSEHIGNVGAPEQRYRKKKPEIFLVLLVVELRRRSSLDPVRQDSNRCCCASGRGYERRKDESTEGLLAA